MTLIFLASGKVVKNPFLDKYGEWGRLKGAVHVYIVYGEGGLFFSGGGTKGREVGPVVTNRASGGGCLLIREILKILQSHRRVAVGTKCFHPTHPPPPEDK